MASPKTQRGNAFDVFATSGPCCRGRAASPMPPGQSVATDEFEALPRSLQGKWNDAKEAELEVSAITELNAGVPVTDLDTNIDIGVRHAA
jgi:hypothetical protein